MADEPLLTTKAGCYILTASGCRIKIRPQQAGGTRAHMPMELEPWEIEDEEIMVVIMAFVEMQA